MYQNLGQIVGAARKVSFTESEIRMVLEAVKARRAKGTDLSLGHPRYTADSEDFKDAANEGFVILHSPEQLSPGFLFVKLDGGRSIFGGQKAVYASYVGRSLYEDQWQSGPTFRIWGIAVTSIGNIYRDEGYR